MYYETMNLKLSKVDKTYFYQEEGYGTKLFEMQIKNLNHI